MATPPARRVPAGPQEIPAVMRTRLIESRLTPNAISLTGFVLITWSASFTYLEMERFWRAEEMDDKQDSRKRE